MLDLGKHAHSAEQSIKQKHFPNPKLELTVMRSICMIKEYNWHRLDPIQSYPVCQIESKLYAQLLAFRI